MQDLMDWKDVIYFQHFKASWFYSFTHSIVYSHAAMHVPNHSAQDHIVQCRRQRTTACLVLIALLELLSAGNDKWVFVRTSHIPQDLLALLQILLTSAAKKLKTHCCPLSVFPLLACRRDLTKRKKLVHMTSCSLAATLSVSVHCLLLVSYLRLQALCFGHQHYLPPFCWWKQCPGNWVTYHQATLKSFFLLSFSCLHTRFHPDFLHNNLSINCEFLQCKQAKLHFSQINPFSILKAILGLWIHIPLFFFLYGSFSKIITGKYEQKLPQR